MIELNEWKGCIHNLQVFLVGVVALLTFSLVLSPITHSQHPEFLNLAQFLLLVLCWALSLNLGSLEAPECCQSNNARYIGAVRIDMAVCVHKRSHLLRQKSPYYSSQEGQYLWCLFYNLERHIFYPLVQVLFYENEG